MKMNDEALDRKMQMRILRRMERRKVEILHNVFRHIDFIKNIFKLQILGKQ